MTGCLFSSGQFFFRFGRARGNFPPRVIEALQVPVAALSQAIRQKQR
jgi:hypothetical protein